MIDLGAVGARFTIVDEASPVLRALTAQLERLDKLIEATKLNLATIKFPPGLNRQLTGMTERMGKLDEAAGGSARAVESAFGKMDASIIATQQRIAALGGEMRALGAESQTIGRLPAPGGLPTVGGGHRRPGRSGGGHGGGAGAYFSGPSAALPGSHVSTHGAEWVAAGALGAGVYEEAKMEDATFQLLYHTGLANTAANKAMFRKTIQDSMSSSGYSLDNVVEAAKTETRMFKGTPGNGIDVLPEMLRIAATEAKVKGSSLDESMKSFVGLAHMFKAYDPEAIKKLAAGFAFASASNPTSLASMERAAGYSVPILAAGLEIDPMTSLMLGTVLTRAGATSTKSGTWLRNMALGAMPGTTFMSEKAAADHKEALGRLGLIDKEGKPTWFTNGKPDMFKLLDIGSEGAAKIPLSERASYEKKAFGIQGFGGFALLADPAVRAQVNALKAEQNSPEFKARYGGFLENLQGNSPVQQARTAFADFSNVAMDIGQSVLPPLTAALGAFDAALKKMHESIGDKAANNVVGGSILAGAAAWLWRGKLAATIPGAAEALGSSFLGPAALLGGGLGAIAASATPGQVKAISDAQKATSALGMNWDKKLTGPGMDLGGGPLSNKLQPIVPMIEGSLDKIPPAVDPKIKSTFAQIEAGIVGALNGLAAAASAAAAAIPKDAGGKKVEIHSKLEVGGRQFAKAVQTAVLTDHRTVRSSNGFDGSRDWAPPDVG